MDSKKRKWFIFGWIDLVLLTVAVALFATGALLLRWYPSTWWRYYLMALDVRIWPPWKCIVFVVILIESLLVIWYWPNKKRRRSAESEQ